MKLYKYRSLQNLEFVLDIILNGRLHCTEYQNLNDPFEGLFFSTFYPRRVNGMIPISISKRKILKSVKNLSILLSKIKICSLSSTLKDVRLWSHYADGHKGIAIEIDFPNELPSVHEVTYVDELREYSVSWLTDPTSEEVLSFKTRHWKFEKEYRIIQEEEFFSIAGLISAIYAGIRTSDNHLALLRKLTPKEIPIFETEIDDRKIEIIPKKQI
jgi:hypothetical protein